ncbi:MAG TPA: ribosome biogenesis GTPase Der [Acidimicrobiales bacterium]|nr:ribosome biogenesis GTPase Der [Acidimicrobiales bacterium]
MSTPVPARAGRLPVVVVAGRPNVGKSTLVNRIAGSQVAIVQEEPGVTRDRLELQCEWAGRDFLLVDTGGVLERGDRLDEKVSEQSLRAVAAADVVLFVLDATTGITGEDADVANRLRKVADKVIVVANKVDSERRELDAWELAGLGLGEPAMVSALHGRGMGDLLDDLVARLPEPGAEPESAEAEAPGEVPATAVAIVGRPNVGKSTLFNRLVGEDRSIVHDMPGTTRDAIDTLLETEAGTLRLVDTAGMRRRARAGEAPEYYSLVRSLRALDRADVALLVLDATEGVTHQDQRLAERVDASGSPVVVLLNKWDLLDTEHRLAVNDEVGDKLAFLGYAPVLRISARTGLGVSRLIPVLAESIAAYHRRIPTARLNEALRAAQSAHPAPGARILYGVQGAVDPPTVTLFATRRLPPPYLRYLERFLRERFELGPTPIDMRVRVRTGR